MKDAPHQLQQTPCPTACERVIQRLDRQFVPNDCEVAYRRMIFKALSEEVFNAETSDGNPVRNVGDVAHWLKELAEVEPHA
jgi:hypothetical protein